MKTTFRIKIDPRDPDFVRLREIARETREGKIVAFPTETVYGIGAPINVPRLDKILAEIKERDPDKPFSYHLGDLGMLEVLEISLTPALRFLTQNFWPGPLTVLVKNHHGEKVGIRYPRHRVTLALINAAGMPFLGTSANLAGNPSAKTADEVATQLDGRVDFLIDSGPCELGQDSTIVDLVEEPPVMLRRGAEADAIAQVLEKIKSGTYPKKKILIVCTGNSCRSPMAAGWLKNELKKYHLEEKIEVASCGVGARPGAPATMEAILVMKNREIDISGHRSQPCTREDVLSSDLILAMGSEHTVFIQGMIPQAKDRIKLLGIPDPIGMQMAMYEQVIQSIEKKLQGLWDEIIRGV